MFGGLPHFHLAIPPSGPPKDVPPPTPIQFPRCHPQLTDSSSGAASSTSSTAPPRPKQPLAAMLQSIVRPTEVRLEHFEALGVHVQPNAPLADIIPDLSVVPDFAAWDKVSPDEARRINDQTRNPINNGNKSPGIQTYLERSRELSIDNNSAFRSVRRLPPQPGQPLVRLGNAYEFFRHLESFTTFWEDTSLAPSPPSAHSAPATSADSSSPSVSPCKATDDGDGDSVSSASSVAVTESEAKVPEKEASPPEIRFYRSSTGAQMPGEYRLNIISAFLKLVAYDFGCNVTAPRMEPRLYINTTTLPAPEKEEDGTATAGPAETAGTTGAVEPAPPAPPSKRKGKGPTSYFTSGCTFIFRSPTTREAARAGILEGPVAAVSARHTTAFPEEEGASVDEKRLAASEDRDACIDLARELVAAVLTAQHRAREGRVEQRLGEGEWWTTKPRWGGGAGGPIGREVDAAPNTDEAVADRSEGAGRPTASPTDAVSRSSLSGRGGPGSASGPTPFRPGSLFSGGLVGPPLPSRGASKKPRKGLAMYDNYRMVRPPSSSWDKKTRYMALGRARGADYDDVFVVSTLFHHMSILRVRVPMRLLAALDGEEAADEIAEGRRSWGRLDVVRSRWFDFFLVQDRVEAMQLTWAMMAYMMRQEAATEDVKMKDA